MTPNRPHHGPVTALKSWLREYARRFEEAEYQGEVPSSDPFPHLIIPLGLWALLVFGGTEIVRALAPSWITLLFAVVWLVASGVLVKVGMARYHGLSVPEYSDYLSKRSERHTEVEKRERARKLEREINHEIRELKNMDVVESVAVWGDGVDVELRQRQEENDE